MPAGGLGPACSGTGARGGGNGGGGNPGGAGVGHLALLLLVQAEDAADDCGVVRPVVARSHPAHGGRQGVRCCGSASARQRLPRLLPPGRRPRAAAPRRHAAWLRALAAPPAAPLHHHPLTASRSGRACCSGGSGARAGPWPPSTAAPRRRAGARPARPSVVPGAGRRGQERCWRCCAGRGHAAGQRQVPAAPLRGQRAAQRPVQLPAVHAAKHSTLHTSVWHSATPASPQAPPGSASARRQPVNGRMACAAPAMLSVYVSQPTRSCSTCAGAPRKRGRRERGEPGRDWQLAALARPRAVRGSVGGGVRKGAAPLPSAASCPLLPSRTSPSCMSSRLSSAAASQRAVMSEAAGGSAASMYPISRRGCSCAQCQNVCTPGAAGGRAGGRVGEHAGSGARRARHTPAASAAALPARPAAAACAAAAAPRDRALLRQRRHVSKPWPHARLGELAHGCVQRAAPQRARRHAPQLGRRPPRVGDVAAQAAQQALRVVQRAHALQARRHGRAGGRGEGVGRQARGWQRGCGARAAAACWLQAAAPCCCPHRQHRQASPALAGARLGLWAAARRPPAAPLPPPAPPATPGSPRAAGCRKPRPAPWPAQQSRGSLRRAAGRPGLAARPARPSHRPAAPSRAGWAAASAGAGTAAESRRVRRTQVLPRPPPPAQQQLLPAAAAPPAAPPFLPSPRCGSWVPAAAARRRRCCWPARPAGCRQHWRACVAWRRPGGGRLQALAPRAPPARSAPAAAWLGGTAGAGSRGFRAGAA